MDDVRLSDTLERLPSVTVHVVDDMLESRQIIGRYLEHEGYSVNYSESGEEAFEAIVWGRPDVVVLDIILPGIDGFETCRKLKQNPETALIPIVMVTSLTSAEDRLKGIESGADEFLSKPVNRIELLARVRSLMRLQRARLSLENMKIIAERQKQAYLRQVLSRFLDPTSVTHILSQSEDDASALLKINDRQDAVVMFADLRGFTAMSEALQPQDVVGILNQFFTMLIETTHQQRGTTFNMSGDSLLCGFGLKAGDRSDAAHSACMAALKMQSEFARISEAWTENFGADVGLGIGINRGPVIVGNVGSSLYMNYTMIGDVVNVAARLESHAARGETLVAEAALPSTSSSPQFKFEHLQPVAVKGKSEPLEVHRLDGTVATDLAATLQPGRT